MDPSLDLATQALLIISSKQSLPASERASTGSSPCQPLGQSGSSSKTPSQRLPPLSCSCSAPLLLSLPLLPPPLPPPPSPSLLLLLCLQPPNLWTWTAPTQ